MDNEKHGLIDDRLVELYKCNLTELRTIVRQNCGAIDLNHVSKDNLVLYVLEAEFGYKTIQKFNKFEGEE